MKNLTDFRKTVETGMDPRLVFVTTFLISCGSVLKHLDLD